MDTTSTITQQCMSHESIDPSHIILVILGALLFNLMEVDKLIKSNMKFVFLVWLAKNWIAIIITSISIVTMFLLREDLKQIMGFDMSNRIGCFLAGFTVHSFTSKANNIVKKVEEKNN